MSRERSSAEMEYALALIDRERKLIMDWSPKSGCTIAIKLFFKNMGILEKALKKDPWVHEYRMHNFFNENPTFKEDFENLDFFKFKIVRNPFSRVVSSYLHTMSHPSMRKEVKNTMRLWNADISFKKFIEFLEKVDITTCDPHYAQQKKQYEENGFLFDRILKLENLQDEIHSLNRLLNTNFDLDGISSKHHIEKDASLVGSFIDKRYSKVIKAVPPYDRFFDRELIHRVATIYSKDLHAYDYSYNEFLRSID